MVRSRTVRRPLLQIAVMNTSRRRRPTCRRVTKKPYPLVSLYVQ